MAYFRYYKIGKTILYSSIVSVLFALSFVLVGFPNLIETSDNFLSFIVWFFIESTLIQCISMDRLSPFVYSRNSPVFPLGIAIINLTFYYLFIGLFGKIFNNVEYSDLFVGVFQNSIYGIAGFCIIFLDMLFMSRKKYKVMKAYVSSKVGDDFSEISEKLNNLESIESYNCVNYSKLSDGGYREAWVWQFDWRIGYLSSLKVPYILMIFDNDKLVSKESFLRI